MAEEFLQCFIIFCMWSFDSEWVFMGTIDVYVLAVFIFAFLCGIYIYIKEIQLLL